MPLRSVDFPLLHHSCMLWQITKLYNAPTGWVAFGYLGQTLGLLTTTASRSCVICSLHCVFVAIIAELLRVQRARDAGAIDGSDAATFDLKRLIPAIVAVTGVAIVELTGAAGGPNVGDALSVAQPVRFC